ncbi:hypothetical protein [Calycomorphotria hydatis]|uniref:Uncharacterized protein n=1 Tax=Calycomorphotria hydatis TaxID=2528027 RepID=A0A517TFE2_9PLAN|nr:hypothetical protein [Calycomorphotria hydatis]QDT67096.1 hypothetical protein V22_43690 [Calycomorphotria hydatis]
MVQRVASAQEMIGDFWAKKGREKYSRYSVGVHIKGPTQLVFINNNNDSESNERVLQVEMFRNWLRENHCQEMACCTYPKEGWEDGYTYAMVIDCPDRLTQTHCKTAYERIVGEHLTNL